MKPWVFLDKWLWKIMVPLANLAVKPLSLLGITPNQLTLFNFLIFIPLSAFFFAQNNYSGNLLGLLFALIYSYFDHVDGLLARATGRTSKFGAWFDQRLDIISSGIILAGITYGFFQRDVSNFWLGVGISALFSQIGILSIVFEYERNFYHHPKLWENFKRNKKIANIEKVIMEFIFLKSFLFLFLGTLRYFLFVAVIFNQLKIFLLAWAVFNNLRWVVMLWTYSLALRNQEPKSPVIKIFSKYIGKRN